MIHVCGNNVSIATIKKVELARPKRAGRHWQGIQHGALVTTILNDVEARGWKVLHSKFAMSDDHADMAGAFELSVPGITPPDGQTLSLGLLHSNALRRRLRLVVGTTVRVCANGMATGEVVLAKKHTVNLDLASEVDDAIDAYFIKAKSISKLVASMQARELSPVEAEHILMEAGRLELMPWSRIGKVDAEYRKPTFGEHGTGSCWSLLQAFTYVVKQNPFMEQLEQMNKFRELLPYSTAV